MIERKVQINYNAILVTLSIKEKNNKEYIEDLDASIDEFVSLAEAANIKVVGNIIQNKDAVDVTYFIGKGKLNEIKEYARNLDANLIIFNHELSGSQIRNIEKEIEIDVIDRTMLILEIFAKRAMTKEGKLQVELAQLKYRLPRLSGIGEKLSRLGGGIGTRGPGEKKLEVDKRHIQSRVLEIEKELKDIEKNRSIQRSKRLKSEISIVSLVGYTNAGKSTILNELIKLSNNYDKNKEVFAKDMLFATLDASLRKSNLPNGNEFIITDTVGFVSRLPHTLVKSFKSTLEEINYSDLILHVIDISDKNYKLQMKTTENVLKEIKTENIPIITINNKIDKLNKKSNISIDKRIINISAKNSDDILMLLETIQYFLTNKYKDITLFFPYSKSNFINNIKSKYNNIILEYENDGIKLKTNMSPEDVKKYKLFILES